MSDTCQHSEGCKKATCENRYETRLLGSHCHQLSISQIAMPRSRLSPTFSPMQNRRGKCRSFSAAAPVPTRSYNFSGFVWVPNWQNTAIPFTLAHTNPDIGFAVDKAPITYFQFIKIIFEHGLLHFL